MKVSKEIIARYRKPGLRVIKQFMIPSKSVPGDYHTVKVYEDGSMECDCIRYGAYKKTCRHIQRAKDAVGEE